jgi:uncharacterized protein YbcI
MEAAVAEEILRIHRESYGRGAARSRAYLLEDVVVCILDDLELLPPEKFLIESGQEEAVTRLRHQFQQAVGPSFKAAVERATGRKVTAFISDTSLEPNFAIEIFRLETHS